MNKRLYKYLSAIPKNTRTPQFYGIPKIHKKYVKLPPLRPIVSQSSSRLQPTAKFIDHVLQPLAQSYPDYLQNSTSVVNILQDLQVPDNSTLVAIDVSSLYPSIPQSECLSTIHSELHEHLDLLPFHPNLILRLLHLNMNYNYFKFSNLTFQQVQGTAMGAAFSPTIANIYMSNILKRFLDSSPIKPLIISRYIDDIFMIWSGTTEDLNTFMSNLNSIHPNLKFTHEVSQQSINFLDLTIYKGYNFPFTNILDIKTFQKPLNLYQYLHFTSNHPPNIFKAIIKGECVRFVRTNTTQEGYESTVYLFKNRLKKRGYPAEIVEKTTSIVKYTAVYRHSKSRMHVPTDKRHSIPSTLLSLSLPPTNTHTHTHTHLPASLLCTLTHTLFYIEACLHSNP